MTSHINNRPRAESPFDQNFEFGRYAPLPDDVGDGIVLHHSGFGRT